MLPMSSFHVQVADHIWRIEHADRVGWLVQAAADAANPRPRRQRGVSARVAAAATLLSILLAIVGFR